MFRIISQKLFRRPSNRVIPFSVGEATTSEASSSKSASSDDECVVGCRRWLRRQYRKIGASTKIKATGILKYPLKHTPAKTDLLHPGNVGGNQDEDEIREEDIPTHALPSVPSSSSTATPRRSRRQIIKQKMQEAEEQEEEESSRASSGSKLSWGEDAIKYIEARGDPEEPEPPPVEVSRPKEHEANVVNCCCCFLTPLKKWF